VNKVTLPPTSPLDGHTANGQAAAHSAPATVRANTIGTSAPGTRKTLQLATLLGAEQGIDIDHNGHLYRLQITKAGRLILTK
jgi:hemin uptake protein HemP